MFLADTLNWVHLPEVGACVQEIATNLESVDHTAPIMWAVYSKADQAAARSTGETKTNST